MEADAPTRTAWSKLASSTSGWRLQMPYLFDSCGAGCRRLGALYDEMVVEELSVLVMLMEILRRQDGRYDRHLGLQLNAHQSLDHGVGHELMPVDAPIDDEPGGHDGGIASALREQQCVQRNFQRSGDLKKVDVAFAVSVLGDFRRERDPAPIDDLLVPAGLHKSDPPSAVIAGRDTVLTPTHGCSSSQRNPNGAYGSRRTT